MNSKIISNILIKFNKRAEKVDPNSLVNSFVDVGPLMNVLSTTDNQIFYGRRGTGKTHVLSYLSSLIKQEGDISVYLDLRNIGSTGGLYSDDNIPIAERGTRLLLDTLGALHDGLLEQALSDDINIDLSKVGPVLDSFADSITQVQVVGQFEEEISLKKTTTKQDTQELGISASLNKINASLDLSMQNKSNDETYYSQKQIGAKHHRIHFGDIGKVFRSLSQAMSNKRIWFLLDEWSSVPLQLQPYLADLIRRSIFPAGNIIVKIAAIEKRSVFQIKERHGEYIGIELGGDASADINLDDFILFDNDENKSLDFFKRLLFKHFIELAKQEKISSLPDNPNTLIEWVFSRIDVFKEFVRAAEGVPRDAFSILSIAAQKDYEKKVTMNTIRNASKSWYQRDKETAVSANPKALSLLHWIIDKVIAHRRARAFLLERTIKSPLIDELFDSRVLHLLKKNISGHDTPGKRYDVYKIDYGCYVDLLATSKAPLFLLDDHIPLDVPQDDYRSIRRAILDISEFEDVYNNELKNG